VEADGRPAAGASVLLRPTRGDPVARARPDAHAARLLALNARAFVGLDVATGEDGSWEVRGVPDGEYRVRVEARGLPRWLPSPVRVAGGASVDAGTFALDRGLRVDGRVVAEDGRPLAGARVTLSEEAPPEAADLSSSRTVTTRGDGRFDLPDLLPGAYRLHALREGHEPVTTSFDLEASRSFELALPGGAALEVRVLESGAPYAGVATVTLERTDRPVATDVSRTLRAADGRLVLEGAPTGTWTVTVEAAGGRVGRAPAPVDVSAGRRSSAVVEIAAGAVLEGRVVGPSGAGVPGATVGLRRDGRARRAATTDGEGRYRIEGVAAGTFEMRTSGPGGAPDVREVTLSAGERRTEDVALGEGGRLVVRVVDARGRPRAGARVLAGSRLVVPDASAPRTAADGTVTIEHLPEGEVVLRASADDGTSARGRARVRPGATETVVLTLEAPAPR
jgi:hypothetical protein